MYESLGIAMELDGRSKTEIERVVMSAADFATSPDELMYIASYLSRSGLDRRALQLCQQVVKIQPLRREAYALGLRSAQQMRRPGRHPMGDGRHPQPGLAEERSVDRKDRDSIGPRHARAARKGRSRRRSSTPIARGWTRRPSATASCKVSWTGDADVDFEVEEPSGTICSLNEPRTSRRRREPRRRLCGGRRQFVAGALAKRTFARKGLPASTACGFTACGATSLPAR